jgi:hypothetical protein
MLGRKGSKASVGFAIELNKNIVPYFYDVGVILIDKMRRIATPNTIKKDFAIK